MDPIFIILIVLVLVAFSIAAYAAISTTRDQNRIREMLNLRPGVMIIPSAHGKYEIIRNTAYSMFGGSTGIYRQTIGNYATREEAEKDLEHMNLTQYREKQ